MKRYLIIFLIFLSTVLVAQETEKLIILHTTDVHGSIYPYNYFTDQPATNGLAKVYTVVKRFRMKYDNVLLVDSGDLIQGTPLIYYFDHVDRSLPNPMALVMNYMRYDAFAVGNHDIEQGYLTYMKAQKDSDFPWLSANGILEDGTPFFKPYTIIEKNGLKIGLVGLTTPGIPMWLDKALYPGMHWEDMIRTARKYVQILRPQVDVLIGLFHAGMNPEYSKAATDALGLPNENATRLVAEQVAGFDAIFCGHSHGKFPFKAEDDPLINNSLVVMSASHGRYLGVAELDVESDSHRITDKTAYLLPMDTVTAAPEILDIARPYHLKTLQYIREEIGTVKDTISACLSQLQDTPLIETINKAQLAVTGADISFAASFNKRFIMPPGPIRIKDVYGMYKYENFLYVVEMTGRQIKDFLEYCAAYYTWDATLQRLGFNPKMAGYNYDMAEGIRYTINISRAVGERVENIIFPANGQALDMAKTYKVAMNSYRATGGGGHLAAAGIKQAKVVWKSNEEMRNILADYIREQGGVESTVDGNWRIVK